MSDSIKFDVTKKEIDSYNNITDQLEFYIEDTYAKYQKGDITISSGTTYSSINFNTITTATMFRLNSDQSINIKINGGSEVFVVNENLIWNGSFTAISINNASGTTANIKYELYGTT